MEGDYVQRKLLVLLCLIPTVIVFVTLSSMAQTYFGLSDEAAGYVAILFVPVATLLSLSLSGVYDAGRAKDAVYRVRHKFQRDGYDLKFHTEGGWFFVVGILTITERASYKQPETAEVV